MPSFAPVIFAVIAALPLACDHGPTAPIPDAVVASFHVDTVPAGDSIVFSAAYRFGQSTVQSDNALRWRSTAPQYVSVDSLTGRGLAVLTSPTALRQVAVVAEAHGVTDTVTIFVVHELKRIRLDVPGIVAAGRIFAPLVLAQGDNGFNNFGEWKPGPEMGTITYASSDTSIVATLPDGGLASRRAGVALITAELQGRTDTSSVTVIAGYPVELLSGTEAMLLSDVNDVGQVAGNYWPPAASLRGVMASRAGVTDLGSCIARAINNAGQVACGGSVAGRYSNGVVEYPFGQTPGEATGIAEGGALFGYLADDPSGNPYMYRAFLWTPDSTRRWSEPGFHGATAKVNAAGHGVGTPGSPYSSYLFLPDRVVTLAGGRDGTPAYQVNDSDDVVGREEHMFDYGTAVVWRAANQWKSQFLGPRALVARGISNAGVVVGDGTDGVFMWKDGRTSRLSDVVAEAGWTFPDATPTSESVRISRNGLIAVYGQHASGKNGVVLIRTPVAP